MSIKITVEGSSQINIAEALRCNDLYAQEVGKLPDGRKFLQITTDADGGYTIGSVIPGHGSFSGSILTLDSGRVDPDVISCVVTFLAVRG